MRYAKQLKGAGIILGIGVVGYVLKDHLADINRLLSKGSVEQVAILIKSWGIAAPLLSILLMVLQSILAPIPAFLITGANGAIFGVFWGTIISWIGAMIGGVLSFYLARWFGEAFVKRMIKNEGLWDKVEQISSAYGFKVVFIGRLLPFVSFDFLSYAAGLSKMRILPFVVATGIGMIPGTIAYVLLGNRIARFDGYLSAATLIVVAILGIVAGVKIVKKEKKGRNGGKEG